jgi:hypothetical protein
MTAQPQPDEQENVIEMLQEAFKLRQPIQLINTFRGVPVESEASIAMISQNFVAVNTTGMQTTCVALEKRTYLKSNTLAGTYRAIPIAIDIPNLGVILTKFVRVGASFGKRVELRVQPREPLRIKIHRASKTITGTIADLSPSGVGAFLFGATTEDDIQLSRADMVDIELPLPGLAHPLLLNGHVMNIHPDLESGVQRLGFRIRPGNEDRLAISEYISERKDEIMVELEALYEQMRTEPA